MIEKNSSVKIYHQNYARNFFRVFKFKTTIRIIILLMLVNIFISISILCQQSNLNVFYKKLCMQNEYIYDQKELLDSLNSFRLYNKINSKRTKRPALVTSNLDSDFKLDKYLISGLKTNGYRLGSFYEPKILLNNDQKCNLSNDSIVIVCLIHSHKNNYLRRKAMRDTWLTMNQIWLAELSNSTDFKHKKIRIEHMFIIGSDEKNDTFSTIKSESDHYKDMIVIDTVDNYKNLIYKHLTVVNWVLRYCLKATFVVKIDDDVFVNIKSLSKHLLEKFSLGLGTSKFIYCNINEMAYPMRKNVSKWFVDTNTYPFTLYPKYCEGFAYITNVATIQLMYEQSKIIPRFWIDDVYFTGLLLHGLSDIKWYDFKNELKWSYYDFWDLGNTLKIYELYAKFLNFFKINAIDFYLSDFFVVLHSQLDNKEINYNLVPIDSSFIPLINTSSNLSNKEGFKFFTCLGNENYSNKENCSGTLSSFNEKKKILFINFYKFCTNLWKKTIA